MASGENSFFSLSAGAFNMKHLIVLPAFNEEECIARVLQDVKESNPASDILLVNDGSSDKTSEIARQMGVMVIDIPFNIGYGGAIQTGFRFAGENGYDFVIIMDADGQHDPNYTKNLIDAVEKEEADVVIGSRFLEGTYKMGLARKTGCLVVLQNS